MGLFASSILVKYSLLNNSGSLVYAGNSSLSLRIWGAQLELAEYSEDILNDYIQNYRYTRTTGIEHNFIGLRFGTGAGGDPSTDFIIIGGTSGNRHTSFGLETQNFFVDKAPNRGLDLGTLVTTSSQTIVTSTLVTTSTTNMFLNSEQLQLWSTSGSVLVTSNTIVSSPIGGSSNQAVTNASLIIFPSNTPGTVFQSIGANSFTDYLFSIWLRLPDNSSTTDLWLGSSTNLVQDYQTSITLTSSWQRYQLPRPTTSSSTANISLRLDNSNFALGNNTSKPALVYAWGGQAITSNSTVSSLGYSYYVRTTSAGLHSVPVSSTQNLLLWSEDLTQTGTWLSVTHPPIRTSVPNYSPEGNSTILIDDQFTGNDGAGIEQVLSITASTSNVYTISGFFRRHSAPTFDLYNFFLGHSTRGSYIRYNFDTDTLTAFGADGGGNIPFNVKRSVLSSGWVKISYNIVDAAFPNTVLVYRFYPATRDAGFVGATYLWGAQVVNATQTANIDAIPYLRTTSAAINYAASTGITATLTSITSILTSTTSFTLSQLFSSTSISGASRELIFAGQQYRFDTRLSGDPMERLSFDYTKRVELNTIKYNLTSDYYQAIAYSTSGGFVAVTNPINSGTVATFATSEDGTTWRQVNTSQQGSWVDIIYGKAGYLAVAQFTSIAVLGNATSPKTWNNLNSWSSVTLPFRADNWSLAASPDYYVAAPAYTNTVTSVIAKSTNGSTWTTSNLGIAANWSGIAWCSSLSSFALIARNTSIVLISKNATTWSAINVTYSAAWTDIAASPDGLIMAVAADTSTAIFTLNGTSWATATLPVSSTWTGITYDDGSFIAVNEKTRNAAKTYNLGAYVFDLSLPTPIVIDLSAPGTVVLDLNTNVYIGGILWQDLHGFNGSDAAYGNDRWVFVNSKQSRWDRNKESELEYVSDVFENNPNWYQLAPYRSTFAERTYASSALIQPKKENPLNDWVTIGENSQTRMQTGESNLENTKFFSTLKPEEGISVPRIPQYDAEQLMELFYNKTGRVIDNQRYTTTSGLYNYIEDNNWYSITPLFSIPKQAFDEYGNSPVYAFNDVEILDVRRNIKQVVKLVGKPSDIKLRYATNVEFLFGIETPYSSSDSVTLQEYFVRGFINTYTEPINLLTTESFVTLTQKFDLTPISDEFFSSLFRSFFANPDSFTLNSRIDSFGIQTTLRTNQEISDEILIDFSVLEFFDQEDDATGIEYDLENIIDPTLDLNV